jgi:hypothetical protein
MLAKLARQERPHARTIPPDGEQTGQRRRVVPAASRLSTQGWHGKAEDQICNNAELNARRKSGGE